MKPPPIFCPGTLTPALPTEPGITLVAAPFRGVRSAWMHGVLTLPDDRAGTAAEWARSLFALAVTELGCQPELAALTRGHAPTGASFIDSGIGLLYLPFHFDLGATLRFPLQPEPTWVHVSAQEYCSEPLRLGPGPTGARAAPEGAVDELIAAYTLVREGDPWAAAGHFRSALTVDALCGDFDGAHLFAAASLASTLIASSDDEHEAARASASALGAWWVADDVNRRAARLARIAVELVASDDAEHATLLVEQASHAAHIARIRQDPQLAPLRARDEFAAIFRPPPT